jgi:peptidoglycan/LPS O-acetylase OafA/YrhL
MQASGGRSGSYIEAIDGLRAIAVLAIIAFHISESYLPGGYVGVDIFYAISGFVVARSVHSLPSGTLGEYFGAFYRRRLLRIFPAIALFVLVTLVFCALFTPIIAQTRHMELVGIASLVGSSNFFIYALNNGYFETGAAFQPFLHTWSLAVEEQYYLIFPLFSFFILKRNKPAVTILVGALCILSLAACALLTASRPSFAFYMLPTRFWELGIGFFLCILLERWEGRGRSLPSWFSMTLSAAAFAVLAASFVLADAKAFPFPWALPPCLATAALIVVVTLSRASLTSRLLASPLPAWIGRLSYSLYLWHWGVIVAMRWTVGMDTPVQQAIAVVLTFAFSAASYYWVEAPIRFNRTLRQMPLPRFAARFGISAALTVAVAGAVAAAKPVITFSATRDRATWWSDDFSKPTGPCQVTYANSGFSTGRFHSFTPHGCSIVKRRTVFVFGDSHSFFYERALFRLASEQGYTVRLYGLGACSPLPLIPPRAPGCSAFRVAARNEIARQVKAGDVLFLAQIWFRWHGSVWQQANPEQALAVNYPRLTADKTAELMAFFRPIVAKQVRILFDGPKPGAAAALFRCADWYDRANQFCKNERPMSRGEFMNTNREAISFYAALSSLPLNGERFEPFDTLCPGPICYGTMNGRPLYIDTNHLSGYANDLLYPSLAKALAK